jgi:hypothetical protein
MSIKRYAVKRDQSEPGILQALRQVGAEVILLDDFDLLVWYRGRLTMLECKSKPDDRKHARKTANQIALLTKGWPITFVQTPEQALTAIGASV